MSSHRISRRLFVSAALAAGSAPWFAWADTPEWPDERQIPPFAIHADFAIETVPQFEGELAGLRRDLATFLTLPQQPTEIHVYLFASASTYREYVTRYFPGVPQRRALFIQANDVPMVFAHRSPHLLTDLRHECCHSLIHQAHKDLPLWLDEGIAEYFEPPQGNRRNRGDYLPQVVQEAKMGEISPLVTLERLRSVDEMGDRQYRHCWAWVHFLRHGPVGAQQALSQYLSAQRQQPPAPVSYFLRGQFADPEADCRRYLMTLGS
ncbi:DUF1570 domain-containing protein [Blastopirellula sp. JC732]|uniref:DUF1570 domain-containing protein n=1 Tax=Blastopirellula sediminis TaxID=2894196 RepID=A0A9X1MUX7_9BACT|nr:DUF1570 domain-containing protein [Blastopirellula sediminis]MCC9604627.1 DUF1570 domain-containing protein [Blastopirellula sediminis]MCC9632074.1 DUF1570 domain-containing protein [Blastopirellula sediminis]